MRDKIKNYTFILILIFSTKAFSSEQLGSSLFIDITRNTIPWDRSISFARDPSTNSNAYFANFPEADHWRNAASTFGPSERQQRALFVNAMANTTMTAAQTDPRSVEFVSQSLGTAINSGEYPLTGHSALEGQEGEIDLSALQYGNSENRYIDGISLSPQLGYYQTVDNEQAFQSTYDNIQLGRAEEALFLQDETSAIEYFNQQLRLYEGESDKQVTSTNYQRDGILRSRETAATFRDFYRFKQEVSRLNLQSMPTSESLMSQCRSNASREIDRTGVYNYIMEPVYSFYSFDAPVTDVDHCSLYVNDQQSFLIKNEPVQKKLSDIIADTERMSSGLDEIVEKLSDQSLSLAEISKYLNNNEVWKELGNRDVAWRECAASNCLDEKEKKIKKVLDYEGGLSGINQNTKELRNRISYIVSNGKLPQDIREAIVKIKGFSDKQNIANLNASHSERKRGAKKSFDQLRKELHANQGDGNQISGRYIANSANNNGSRYLNSRRDGNGTLRTKSGKVVPGFEAPAHHDLFKIISLRYRKKFFGD